jgi:hypothetical protein
VPRTRIRSALRRARPCCRRRPPRTDRHDCIYLHGHLENKAPSSLWRPPGPRPPWRPGRCPVGRTQIWLRLPISRIFPPVAGEAAIAARCDPGAKETALCYGRLESEGGDIDHEPPTQARRIWTCGRYECAPGCGAPAGSARQASRFPFLHAHGPASSKRGVRVVHQRSCELAGRLSNGTRLRRHWRQGPRQR